MLEKFIKIFNANSISHLIIIFIVFGITGSSSVVLSEPILNYLKLDEITNYTAVHMLLRIFVIIVVYQVLLIVVGSIFGQFNYFKKIQKRFLVRIRLIKE
jgi:manganese efflux pump family protein|tara:strand:+ start:199 stop:498 length:300 start_codon:yes stop_codon:yes gene_type:complete